MILYSEFLIKMSFDTQAEMTLVDYAVTPLYNCLGGGSNEGSCGIYFLMGK